MEGLKERIQPIWRGLLVREYEDKGYARVYVIIAPPPSLFHVGGAALPRLAAGLRLQNDNRLLIYSKLISPLIRALVNLRARKLQRS